MAVSFELNQTAFEFVRDLRRRAAFITSHFAAVDDLVCMQIICTIAPDIFDCHSRGRRRIGSRRDALQNFFQQCTELSLTLHGEKFYIGAGEIEIMGHVIGHNTVRMSATKLETILSWSVPVNKKTFVEISRCL